MKKIVAIVLLVCLMVGAVGCSKADNAGKSTGAATDVTKAPAEDVELTVVGGGLSDAAYETAKAANPNDSNVLRTDAVKSLYPDLKVDYQDWGWAEQLDQKQRAAILSGNAPDIVHGEAFMPTYANMDILTPLPQDIIDEVEPAFLIKNAKGEPVAVSPKGNIFLLYYNKDLMKAAGIDPETPITTWDDWKKISDQITANGKGKVFGGGIPTHPTTGGALRATAFIRQLGADFIKEGVVTINTPEMIKALQFIRDMNANYPAGIGNNPDEGPLYSMFNDTQTLFSVVNGTWQTGDSKKKNVNIGVTTLPVSADGSSNNCLVGFDYYGVPKTSEHQDAAFDVIRAFLTKDVAESIVKNDITPCANKEVLNASETSAIDPSLAQAIKAIKAGNVTGLVAFEKNDSQIWNIIDTELLARTTMTEDSIETIVADAQKKVEELLK